MKILVTGACGFIGSHLCERLIELGNSVIGIDNFDSYYEKKIKEENISSIRENKNFVFKKADIRNADMKDISSIDATIHLAAKAGVRASIEKPKDYEETNIKGTINMLEFAKENNTQFIFGSSSSVYGESEVPFKEDQPCINPLSPYAASKRAAELFCYTFHVLYKIHVICLRFFTVYGPRQRPDMAISKFTRLIDNDKAIDIYGDGNSSRDYTYVDDVVNGIINCLGKKGFEIINLGNSKTVELNYLVSLIEKNLGKKAKINYKPEQKGDVPITYADISKGKKLINYAPKVSIEEGIKKYVEWYKKDQHLYKK